MLRNRNDVIFWYLIIVSAHVKHARKDEDVAGRQDERVLVVAVDDGHRPMFATDLFLDLSMFNISEHNLSIQILTNLVTGKKQELFLNCGRKFFTA